MSKEREGIGTVLGTVMISAEELLPWLQGFLVSGPIRRIHIGNRW